MKTRLIDGKESNENKSEFPQLWRENSHPENIWLRTSPKTSVKLVSTPNGFPVGYTDPDFDWSKFTRIAEIITIEFRP